MNNIELNLITGFLGAGKTTLLQNLLKHCQKDNTGLIINDFGPVNIDSRILGSSFKKVVELNNGSMFCSCLNDQFIRSLIEITSLKVSKLYIEASGLADPSGMTRALQIVMQKTGAMFDYTGSICIIDASTFMDLFDCLPVIKKQLEFGRIILINRIDLVDEKTVDNISDIISKVNQDARIIKTSYCRINHSDLLDNRKSCPNVPPSEYRVLNTPDSRPWTVMLKGNLSIPMIQLKKFLGEIFESTYRIKGFSETSDGIFEINVSGKHIQITQWPYQHTGTELVIISAIGPNVMKLISDSLERNFEGQLKITIGKAKGIET